MAGMSSGWLVNRGARFSGVRTSRRETSGVVEKFNVKPKVKQQNSHFPGSASAGALADIADTSSLRRAIWTSSRVVPARFDGL